jgi:hypothetical protein
MTCTAGLPASVVIVAGPAETMRSTAPDWIAAMRLTSSLTTLRSMQSATGSPSRQ